MSLVSDFAKSMHAQAAQIIGLSYLVVDGHSMAITPAEVSDSKSFEIGNERVRSHDVLVRTDALPTSSIIKKLGTIDGETLRVESIRKGSVFTTITLEQVTKA